MHNDNNINATKPATYTEAALPWQRVMLCANSSKPRLRRACCFLTTVSLSQSLQLTINRFKFILKNITPVLTLWTRTVVSEAISPSPSNACGDATSCLSTALMSICMIRYLCNSILQNKIIK